MQTDDTPQTWLKKFTENSFCPINGGFMAFWQVRCHYMQGTIIYRSFFQELIRQKSFYD